MATPSSQTAAACPISFVLQDDTDGSVHSVTLAIRPEDLTRTEPNRVATVQTLGGAYADTFGKGLPTINISGHTGWRGYTPGGMDGVARFQQLYDLVVTQWQQRRADATQSGQDPDKVYLVFADSLNSRTDMVIPTSFVLRRNKSRPLLAQYQITMTGLNRPVGVPMQATASNLDATTTRLNDQGLVSLANSLTTMQNFQAAAGSVLPASLAGPVGGFMSAVMPVVGKVQTVLGGPLKSVAGIVGPLLSVARSTTGSGEKLFAGLLVASPLLPTDARFALMQVQAAFANVSCLLSNVFSAWRRVPDYHPLFGSSYCSSTAGGSPPSPLFGQNIWSQLLPGNSSPVSVTSSAAAALSMVGQSDPVLAPLSQGRLLLAASQVTGGITVS